LRLARICFYGLFGRGNLGNECTLQAILYHTRRYFPDADLLCVCSGPDDTAVRHHIRTVPISTRDGRGADPKALRGAGARPASWLRRTFLRIPKELRDWVVTFKTLSGKDMFIVPGTGFLNDAVSPPLGWPYDLFKWSLVAKLCRCKLVYVGVGAGPIYHPLSRWLITTALALADFRSYRDNSTMEYLKGIGFSRSADRVCPDLAFSLPPALLASAAPEERARPVVGIGLMDFPARLTTDKPDPAIHRAYLEKLARFARWLLTHDYDVRVLIGDIAYDQAVLKQFRALLSDEMSADHAGRVTETPVTSVEELLAQLASTDLVVATRFHNVVLSLILNKPVIAISFHHKSASLMKWMGLSAYTQDMSDLDLDRLIEQFRELEKNAEPLKASMRQRTEESRKLLDEQYRVIFDDLGGAVRRSLVTPSAAPSRTARD
jgi:polysaccharide pyruvyl transferase WcaK-like protein